MKFYTAIEILPITKQIGLINGKNFVKIALNKNIKIFVIYILSFGLSLILIYLAKKAQIVLLLTKKIIILNIYFDFINIFLK